MKSLWLLKYKSQLQQTPPQTQTARFEAGDEVGELALQLFDCADKISFENSTFNEKIAQTKAFIDKAMGQIANKLRWLKFKVKHHKSQAF